MDKFAIYYGARAFFYQLLYGWLFGIASGVFAFILGAIIVECHIVLSWEIEFFAAIGLFCILCVLVFSYFQAKLSLKKMFFKPYKKIMITTEMEQIPPKMVFIFLGMYHLPSFFIAYLIDKNFMHNIEIHVNLIKCILLGLLINFCLTCLVSMYLVHKYATVTPKQPVM